MTSNQNKQHNCGNTSNSSTPNALNSNKNTTKIHIKDKTIADAKLTFPNEMSSSFESSRNVSKNDILYRITIKFKSSQFTVPHTTDSNAYRSNRACYSKISEIFNNVASK